MTPQEFMQTYQKAIASQDWQNVEPLMHDDVCVTFSTGTFKGKPEVQKVFEHNFTAIKSEQYSIAGLHWAFIGSEAAICLYTFQWQGFVNGESVSGGGRGTCALVNSQGSWQILTVHLGPNAV